MNSLQRHFVSRKWIFLTALVVAGVTTVIYHPALQIGFWTDDYMMLDWAIRKPLVDYLISYFDPRATWLWYRPLQGVWFGIQYALSGGNPYLYHILQVLLHVANSLLLFGLVLHVSRRLRFALIASLLYATLPTYSLAIYWVSVHDPLASFFYLAAIVLWITYLETGSRIRAAATFVALVCALLSKEAAASLPISLFLADRWLVGKPAPLAVLIKRYWAFLVVLGVYALLVYPVVTQGAFVQISGYGIGIQIFSNFAQYLTQLAFPWGLPSPLIYIWIAMIIGAFAYAAVRHEWRVVYIGVAAVVTLSPALPFQGMILRYTYLPLMASAVGFALLFELGLTWLSRLHVRRVMQGAAALALALLVVVSGRAIGEGAQAIAGVAQQTRLQLQPVFRRHSTFVSDTYLYFVDPPFTELNLSGLIAQRYGNNAIVSGVDYGRVAGLRDHRQAFVYYADDQGVLQESPVDPNATVRVTPSLPVRFEESISLDGFEVTTTKVKRGESIVLILYWRAAQKPDKNYTIFSHFVDRNGKMIRGYDTQSRHGNYPTGSWKPGTLVIDPIVLPIGLDVPVGNGYRMELGMYYLPTMQRLSILDGAGQPAGDAVVLEPFSIVP